MTGTAKEERQVKSLSKLISAVYKAYKLVAILPTLLDGDSGSTDSRSICRIMLFTDAYVYVGKEGLFLTR